MTDRVFGMEVRNPLNPGGIKATLRRWWEDPQQQERWVTFDGVTVSLRDSLGGIEDGRYVDALREGERSICLVKELASVFGNEAHLTLHELLYNNY